MDLLQTFMTQRALRMLNLLDKSEIDTFAQFKLRLLKEFRLTSGKYRDMFQTAEKQQDETWTNCTTRLFTLYRCYLDSQNVDTFEQLKSYDGRGSIKRDVT